MSDNFFLKTPDGRDIPSSASKVGGIVLQLEGTNGVTLFTQTKASSLFEGRFSSSPGVVGTQGGLDLSNLGGGLARVSMRWTIDDGDTSSGNFDNGDITLGLNGVSLESASGLTTYTHDNSGNNTTEASGFPNNLTATGWVTTTDSSKLSTIFSSITNNSNTATFNLFDSDVNDNFFDFKQGIDAELSEQESAPNSAPTLSSFTTLTGVDEDQYLSITHSDLLSASNAADSDGDPISFRVEAVTTGTLEKSVAGSWLSVTPGSTLIDSNDTVRWKGASNANGTLNAFTLKAFDGDLTSSSAVQVTVEVTPTNDAPTLSGAGGTLTFTEGIGSTVIDSSLTVADVDDSNIESATVSFSSGFVASEDVLSFSNTSEIIGSYNSSTGVLSLSGTATLVQYEEALESIRYNNTSGNPNTSNRTISWTVNDGDENSSAVTSTITVVRAPAISSATYNDATGILTVTGSNLPAYSGSNNDIDVSKLTISGQGGSTYTLTSGDVELTSSTEFSITLSGADQLAIAPLINKNGTSSVGGNTYNIAAAEDWAPGADISSNIADLTGNGLTASNTPNQLQVLPNTTTAIDLDGSSSSPSGEKVAKGFDGSITTKYLNFGENNSGVEFSFSSAFKLTNFEIYTANDADARDPASYELYGSSDGGTSFSSLATGTLSLPTTRFAAGGLVNLSLSSSYSTYRLIFPTVRNAGSANSMQLAELILYGVANSAPVLSGASSTLAFTEGDGDTVIDASLTISDADNTNIESSTITISSGFQSTEDNLTFIDANGITGSWNSTEGVLTLSGSATKAQYETALESVTYNNTSEKPNTANRTISWSVNDGSDNSSAVFSTISVAAVNDTPTGSVSISGTAIEDQTLTASNTLADADGLGTISYQWRRDGSVIDDATGSNYTLTQADVGSAITVTASYTDGQGTSESVTSSATSAVANVNDTPTGSVSISGTAIQNQQLTVTNTLADADGLGSISYQWNRDGLAIDSATGSNYTLTQADVGSAITVTANYTDGQETTERVTSTATDAVTNINDVPTGSLTISGIPQYKQQLVANHTLDDSDGLGAIYYQWRRDSSLIPVAITNKYILTKCDIGSTITVSAHYTDSYGASESITSSATTTVTSANESSSRLQRSSSRLKKSSTQSSRDGPLVNLATKDAAVCINSSPTGLVSLSGTPRQNKVLTATNTLDDADGIGSISYQWNRNHAAISGSVGSTYTLTQADVGSFITVTASYSDGEGVSERITSTATEEIANVDDPAVIVGNITRSGIKNSDQIIGSLAATDIDGLTDGTIYSIQANDQAINGTASIDPVSGSWSYRANTDFAGTDSFFVSITDDFGGITRQQIELIISGVDQITLIPDLNNPFNIDSIDYIINGLNSSEWANLRKVEIRDLTAKQLQILSGDSLALFKPSKIKAIDQDAVSGLEANAINQLNQKQIKAIPAQGLTSQQLSGFSTDTFKALKAKQFGKLRPDAITGLRSKHLKTLSGKDLSAFKPASFKAIDPDQISNLKSDSLDALKTRQIKAITNDQLAGLSQKQTKNADDFLEMLSNQQLQTLSFDPLQMQ